MPASSPYRVSKWSLAAVWVKSGKKRCRDSWRGFSWLLVIGGQQRRRRSWGFDGEYDLKPEVLVEGEELITLLFAKHIRCRTKCSCMLLIYIPLIVRSTNTDHNYRYLQSLWKESYIMSTVLSAWPAFASLAVRLIIECQRERAIPFIAGYTMFIVYLFRRKSFPNHLRKVSHADTCI